MLNKRKTLIFLSSLLSFYYVLRGFGEVLFFEHLANKAFQIFTLCFSLIYIYLIDNFKIQIKEKLKFPFVNIHFNLLMIISAIAIGINISILIGLREAKDFANFYLFLVYLESFTLLRVASKLRILGIIPNMREFIKWTKYSAFAALTIILYPLSMVLFGFSLYTLGKLFDTIDKIKVNNK